MKRRGPLHVLMLLLNLSCSSNSDDSDDSTHEAFEVVSVTSEDAGQESITDSSCEGSPPSTGTLRPHSFEINGDVRSYQLFVPESYDHSAPTPLLINFHSTGGTGRTQAIYSATNLTAREMGFVVVYPDGLDLEGYGGVFDAGHRDFSAQPRDDVAFTRALVDEVASSVCIDKKRVYATGGSNGGRMAYRLACEGADFIAAIAPVAGQLTLAEDQCKPSRPVPLIHFHGTADTISPYDRIAALAPRTIPQMFSLWAEKNGCESGPVESFAQDDVLCQRYEDCEAGAAVELCTVEGGGHCWFGTPQCEVGESTTTINASEKMMHFMLNFALP